MDNHGLFVVCRIRDDIQKAREVQKQIRDGDLRAFSIGGQALFRVTKTTPEWGTHREITDLELHEITLCKKGINPEAGYTILKMENPTDNEGLNMSNAETLTEIKEGLTRVLSHLGSADISKADDKAMKDEKGAYMEDAEEDETETQKSEDSALAYIDTLEKFAHEAGVNLDALRDHFGLEKAYLQEGSGGYSHRGQGDEVGSGEGATEPTYPALPAPSGNQNVIKGPGVAPMQMNGPSGNENVVKASDLTPESMERGYRAYAAIRDEQALKGMVQKEWESRYTAETEQALALRKQNDFGGQIEALRSEIASLRMENSDLQKSATPPLRSRACAFRRTKSSRTWAPASTLGRATEALARRALRGE